MSPTLPTSDAVRQIIDDLGWRTISSWVDDAAWSLDQERNLVLVIMYDEDGDADLDSDLTSLTLTMSQLRAAVYDLSTGKITTDPYQIRSATEYLDPDWYNLADGDANTADLVVQWAAFGEIVYG